MITTKTVTAERRHRLSRAERRAVAEGTMQAPEIEYKEVTEYTVSGTITAIERAGLGWVLTVDGDEIYTSVLYDPATALTRFAVGVSVTATTRIRRADGRVSLDEAEVATR